MLGFTHFDAGVGLSIVSTLGLSSVLGLWISTQWTYEARQNSYFYKFCGIVQTASSACLLVYVLYHAWYIWYFTK